MKIRILLLSICFLIYTPQAESQILKKLKKKVEKTTERVLLNKTEEKTEKVVEGAIDGTDNTTTNDQNKAADTEKNSNSAKLINTDAKRSFYTSDVIVTTSDDKGKGSEYYFDSDELAAKGLSPNSDKPVYIDSEGFQYGYNESANRWEKTGLMRSDAMSFMMPSMSMGILKLPVGPTMETSKKFKEQGMNMNTFQIVEWAFIYKPEHFRNADYKETTGPCPDGGSCPKFFYTDPDYEGSWVLFDEKGRLSEIYAEVNTQQMQGNGSYKFDYKPVSVSIPPAVEVKMPFQDIFMTGADVDGPTGDRGMVEENGNDYDTGASPESMNSINQNRNTSNVDKDELPDIYDFDWRYELKMDMQTKKQESMDLIFLLKENSNYHGIKFKNPKDNSFDDATIVFDLNIKAMLMFMSSGNSKILQIHSMKEPDVKGDAGEFQIRELPAKTIIGFHSKGMEIENDKFIVQVYHTTEAPIEMSNLFNFSGSMDMKMPDIDPRLVKQFSNGLITEMHYIDKKKEKNNVLLTAISLNKSKTTINKNEYQNMSFMGQLNPGKN